MFHAGIAGKPKTIRRGCVMVYYPDHPSAWRVSGYFYLHRLVMENHLKRYLRRSERVYHLDGDKLNNKTSNLSLHRPGGPRGVYQLCAYCGKIFLPSRAQTIHCSPRCGNNSLRKIEWPPDEELKTLVWDRPVSTVAKELGVSNIAVSRMCKRRGISTPPRGYWQKKQSNAVKEVG